jgi:hypothetical protein
LLDSQRQPNVIAPDPGSTRCDMRSRLRLRRCR